MHFTEDAHPDSRCWTYCAPLRGASLWGGGPVTATLDAQRRHESPELGAMVGRMLNALIRRAAEGDTEAVEQLGRLETLARQANTSGLAEARRTGYSLAELARVTGTTRQAVSMRTAKPPVDGTHPGCAHHGCVGMRRCRIA